MFKPMLAKDAELSRLTFPLIAQPKLDGIRASVVEGRLLTRTLKEVPNHQIFNVLSAPEFEGLDGELIVGDPNAADCYRRTASFVMASNKRDEPWAFHAFDKWNHPGVAARRIEVATRLVRDLGGVHLVMVSSQICSNMESLADYEEHLVSAGFEGVIVRDPDAPYKFGRSGKNGPLLKIKRYVDFEAEVINVYEEQHNANEALKNELGRTQRSSAKAGKVGKDTLGGLVLRALNGPWEGAEFRCGTGFDAAMRADLWAAWQGCHRPSLAPGKVAKIKAFDVGSKDKPRHPVFLGWRDMGLDGMTPLGTYGRNVQTVADSVRTGPFEEMRAMGALTADDLRAGAERCERDAQFRRGLAAQMDADGVREITVHDARALRSGV